MKIQNGIVILSLVALGLALSCKDSKISATNLQASNVHISREKLKFLCNKLKIELPTNMRVLGLDEDAGGMDSAIYLKVEVKPEELESFLSKSPFANIELRSDRMSVSNREDLSWWRPEMVKTFRSGQAKLSEADYLNILIDLDRKDKIDIFLMSFST